MKRSEERAYNIRKVIKTAQSLFISDGIAATPITRIAEAADLTPTSLYRYFQNKDALVFAAWQDALVTFYGAFLDRYVRITPKPQNGYEKFVACMDIYFSFYHEMPEWYDYTREMFSSYSEKNQDNEVKNVFWKYYDKEIPIPVLKALRAGVADGSIRPDVNIYAVYQCLLNAYTGTTIYENVSFGVSPVEIVRFTGELIANYIKNER
ncbi:MAG: TetR/AcrR family transcriptional regulator [Oscillospiraceae bacterium]|nr:TetR/AcrR family transcriptional regulator [Oscillospiraceae bacterium]